MIDAEFVKSIADLQLRGEAVDLVTTYPELENGFAAPRLTHLAVPDGVKLEDVTQKLLFLLPTPQHRAGNKKLASLQSFVDFVNRYTEPSTVLFANPGTSTIAAVFDYHDALHEPPLALADSADGIRTTPLPEITNPRPRWGRFTATYAFPFSRAWKVWKESNVKPMSQVALAGFIEDNIIDVNDTADVDKLVSANNKNLIGTLGLTLANRAKLLGAARGLSLHVEEKLGAVVNTQTGEIAVNYEQVHSGEGAPAGTATKVDVPSAFTVFLPVYDGAMPFELLVRLRYRKDGQALRWHYDVYQIERALELAFQESVKEIVAGTGIPVFFVAD